MSFSLSGSVITQSGTDANLSGLSAIAGVTTTTIGTSPFQIRRYNLAALRLVVTGTVTHNPLLEEVVWSDTVASNTLTINAGATYNYGHSIVLAGETVRVMATGLRFTKRHVQHYDQFDISILGTFNWSSGRIEGRNCGIYAAVSGGALNVTGDAHVYSAQGASINDLNIPAYVRPTNVTGRLTIEGQALLINREVAQKNVRATGGAQFDGIGNQTIVGLDFVATEKACVLGFSHLGKPVLQNAVRGTNTTIGSLYATVNANNGGQIEAWQHVKVVCKRADGTPLAAESVYIPDNNNGNRKDATSRVDSSFNFWNDRPLVILSDPAGAAVGNVFLGAVVTLGNTNPSVGDTGAYRWDRRSKQDLQGSYTNTDARDLHVWGYETQYASTTAGLNGKGTEIIIDVLKIGDNNVTKTRTQASALTSVATLDDLYDAAKFWKCQPGWPRLEYPTRSTQPVNGVGTTIDLGGHNLVINGAAASAFEINTGTNTITIKSASLQAGSKFAYLKTTGTVTTVNGGGIAVNYLDANGAVVSLAQDGGGTFSGMVRINGVDGQPYHNVASIPLTLVPSDTVRIYMIAYGRKGRVINTTGEALLQNATFALDLDSAVDTTVSTTRRNEVAAALDMVMDGAGNIGATVGSNLVSYTPAEALAGFHWWLVSEGTFGFSAALAANTPDLMTTDIGSVVIGSANLFVQPSDAWGTTLTVPAAGVYVPLVIRSSVPGYNPLRKNASGVVLGTALWTQTTAAMAAADRDAIVSQVEQSDVLALKSHVQVVNEGVQKASLLIPHAGVVV